jgi:predicted metal-binding membrane protein
MTPAARERLHVRTPLLLLSAAAWMLLAVQPGGMALAHCPPAMMRAATWPASLDMLLARNPPATLALGWALMLAAMMLPLLIAPVRHVRDRSFAQRRARAIALFVSGYTGVWMVAGAVLLSLAMAARLAAPVSLAPVAAAAAIALVWQFSPVKQLCLNRGHAHAALAAFGPAADLDALRFGVMHGVWCVGSCWALMLVPLLVSTGHLAAMAVVSLWLFAEKLDRPMPRRWRVRAPGKAARIAIAQTRILLERS